MATQTILMQDGENVREATAKEIEEMQKVQSDFQAIDALHNAKLAARESALGKLAALGLTADEVAAL